MTTTPPNLRSQSLALLFGGVLPVIAFTLVEERWGVVWGTTAGMVFGLGECIYEKVKHGRVSGITWFANALILGLGAISLVSSEGLWFKLQPAILLAFFGGAVLVSSFLRKPLLVELSKKQNPNLPPEALAFLVKVNWRLGAVFLALSGLMAWAALSWSSEAWAFLKSVGVMILLFIYLACEVVILRLKRKR